MDDLWLKLGNCAIRYRDTGGPGPVVLLTHGVSASLETWEAQLASAGSQLRLITWDLPGHGLSDFGDQPYGPAKFAQVGWQLLDALNIERVALTGNSLGGAISIAMADMRPENVTHLCLLCAATLNTEFVLPLRLASPSVLSSIMSSLGDMAVQQHIQTLFHESYVATPRVKKIIERNMMRPGAQAAFVNTLYEMTTFGGQRQSIVTQTQEILSAITVPVLFIHGRQDLVIPLAHSEFAQTITPGSKLEILEDCGHTPQIEKPEFINNALVEFVIGA